MKKNLSLDWALIIPIIIIFTLGLTVLGSISLKLLFGQLTIFILSLVFFYIFSTFPFQSHKLLSKIYAVSALTLLLLPFIFSTATRGTVRWLQIGSLTLQPSEIIKPFFILILANFLSLKPQLNQLSKFLKYLTLLIIPAFLIFKQPDLGSSLVVAAIWLGMLIVSTTPRSIILTFSILGLSLSPLLFKLLKPYQKLRITAFLNPFADPQKSGYHLIQSIIAIGSGGFLGRGLGHGIQSQLQFLPERHTDFIFASYAEESGFLGVIFLILVYYLLLKRILIIAQRSPSQFSLLICIGVFSMIFFQTIVNISMNLGLMPITGITLPLMSAGGSSILATMIALGIIHNISINSNSKKTLEIK